MAKRLKKILVGELVFGVSILFGGEESGLATSPYINTIYMTAIISAIIGLMIIFLGVYRFPVFLEFGWRDNLVKLFIIDQIHLKALYIHDFNQGRKEGEKDERSISEEEREALFSKGIIGVEEVINTIMKGKKKKLEKIEHGNLLILLTYGENPVSFITYALIVEKDMKSFPYFLNIVKEQFQGFYKEILQNLDDFAGKEEKLFSNFDLIISNLIK